MGTDKALVRVDGVEMVSRVVGALRDAGAFDVACIGGNRDALERLGLTVVDDEWPGEGPLGGLATALAWSPASAVVAAGCDQPWLDGPTISRLVEAHRARAVGSVTVYRVDGRAQPLPGVYDVGLRAGLVAAMADGQRALRCALRLAEPCVVESRDPTPVADIDRPEDLPAP